MRQQQQYALLHQQQQATPAPPASPGRQQGTEDTLAGDLEVLSQHLQTARICQQNKASMSTAVSPAGPAGASLPPSAAMQFTANGAHAAQVRWPLRTKQIVGPWQAAHFGTRLAVHCKLQCHPGKGWPGPVLHVLDA